jgi:hypothetical protein
MHAIFRVNELLLEIFTHVGNAGRGGKGDLAALARTCKAFSYAALGQLWNDMSGMVKLLSLFPIIRKRRGTSALSEITFVRGTFLGTLYILTSMTHAGPRKAAKPPALGQIQLLCQHGSTFGVLRQRRDLFHFETRVGIVTTSKPPLLAP